VFTASVLILGDVADSLARIISKHIRVVRIPRGFEEIQKVVADVIYASTKIVAVLTATAIIAAFLKYFALILIPLAIYLLYRYHEELVRNVEKLYAGVKPAKAYRRLHEAPYSGCIGDVSHIYGCSNG